ncbi:MAG: APA family basic amino acid/polyamine antiporter, partial [Gammaproteobacteria bacterium]
HTNNIGMASSSFESLPQRLPEIIDTTRLLTADGATAVVLGAVLAFYAFIGFEDMVNVAEEVTDPVRTLPRGIFIAIIVSTLLYLLVSVVAILSLPPDQLANSAAPLADIVAAHGYDPRLSIAAISLLAVTNGALVQIIMASRVIYGLGETNGAPKILARIHPRYRTPARATALVTAAVCVFALWFPIEPLARATSVLTLCTFIVVNLAVIWLRLTSTPPRDVPQYPLAFPIAGAFTCAGLLLWQLHAWL